MPILNFGDSLYKITGNPENEKEIKFDIYRFYLDNFFQFIKDTYPKKTDLISHVWSNTQKIQRNKKLDLTYIYEKLCLAWNTEYLAKLNDNTEDINLLRLINQWKPVQVYYSVYSLSEAVLYAITNSKVGQHKSCLNRLSDFLTTKDIPPWSLSFIGYLGNKKVPRTIRPNNFPLGLIIPNTLQRQGIKPIESIACCLQAEHRNRIDEHIKNKNEKPKYLYEPGTTTLLHFLYRLRIKSNYKDAEIFMIEAPEYRIKEFSVNSTHLNDTTNLILEIILMRRIGKRIFFNFIDKFVKINNKADFLKNRHKLYEKYCL
jgi:hypothetical protein